MANILIVDDEEKILQVVGTFLSRMGYGVVSANGGAEALRIISSGTPLDFMVIDMRMPDVDGLMVIKQSRAMGRELPMVILTGTPDTEGYRKMIQCVGASEGDVLRKPVNLFELLVKVKEKLPAA